MMMISSILILALAANLPKPLTEIQNREIGCVAVLAILAEDQRRSARGSADYPDVQADGRRWAGIIGDRITFESGQPKEVIGFAMREAAKAEQARIIGVGDPRSKFDRRMLECLPLMRADLAKDATSQ
jgi:hypothetical protein